MRWCGVARTTASILRSVAAALARVVVRCVWSSAARLSRADAMRSSTFVRFRTCTNQPQSRVFANQAPLSQIESCAHPQLPQPPGSVLDACIPRSGPNPARSRSRNPKQLTQSRPQLMQHRETHHSSSIYDGYVFHKPAGRGSAASSPQARLLLRWAQRARQRVRLIDDECALQCDGVTAGSLSTSRRRTRSHRMGRRAHGGAHHGQLGAVEQLAAESNALRPRGGGHASVRGRAPLSHGPHRKARAAPARDPPQQSCARCCAAERRKHARGS